MRTAGTPRVGLIGCGRWGRNIARVLVGHGALAAIGLRTPRETGFEAPVMGVEALLASDVEAVAIAVPPSEHRDLVTAALRAGKHVFVEKPLALNSADARACAEAAKAAGKVLMVGHIMRHNPAFARLLEMVRAGDIGAVRGVSSVRVGAAQGRPGDSALWLLAPHDASMVLALLGRPDEVTGEVVGEEQRISLRYAGGVGAEIAVSRSAERKHSELIVTGDKGALVYEDTAPLEHRLLRYEDPARHSGGERIALPDVEPLAAEIACFLGAVRGRSPPLADADEGLAVVELLERAERRA